MLSQSTREDLMAERERLHRRVDAIDALLAEEAPSGQPRRPQQRAVRGSGDGIGLAAMMRRVLRETGGCSTDDLVKRIEGSGYVHSGNTPLRTRVTTELNRMRKRGEARMQGRKHMLQAELPAAGGDRVS